MRVCRTPLLRAIAEDLGNKIEDATDEAGDELEEAGDKVKVQRNKLGIVIV